MRSDTGMDLCTIFIGFGSKLYRKFAIFTQKYVSREIYQGVFKGQTVVDHQHCGVRAVDSRVRQEQPDRGVAAQTEEQSTYF